MADVQSSRASMLVIIIMRKNEEIRPDGKSVIKAINCLLYSYVTVVGLFVLCHSAKKCIFSGQPF